MLIPSEQGFRSLSNSQIHSDRRLESGFKREEEGQVCLTQRKVLVGTGRLYLYLYLNQNHFYMRRVGSKERGTGLSDASESVGGNLLAGGLVGGMRVGPACSLLTRGQLVKMHTGEKSNKCNQRYHASSPMNSFKTGKQVDL